MRAFILGLRLLLVSCSITNFTIVIMKYWSNSFLHQKTELMGSGQLLSSGAFMGGCSIYSLEAMFDLICIRAIIFWRRLTDFGTIGNDLGFTFRSFGTICRTIWLQQNDDRSTQPNPLRNLPACLSGFALSLEITRFSWGKFYASWATICLPCGFLWR